MANLPPVALYQAGRQPVRFPLVGEPMGEHIGKNDLTRFERTRNLRYFTAEGKQVAVSLYERVVYSVQDHGIDFLYQLGNFNNDPLALNWITFGFGGGPAKASPGIADDEITRAGYFQDGPGTVAPTLFYRDRQNTDTGSGFGFWRSQGFFFPDGLPPHTKSCMLWLSTIQTQFSSRLNLLHLGRTGPLRADGLPTMVEVSLVEAATPGLDFNTGFDPGS